VHADPERRRTVVHRTNPNTRFGGSEFFFYFDFLLFAIRLASVSKISCAIPRLIA
jgi:hypothetical protein